MEGDNQKMNKINMLKRKLENAMIEAYEHLSEEKRFKYSAMYIEKSINTRLTIDDHIDILNKVGTTTTTKASEISPLNAQDSKEATIKKDQSLTNRVPAELNVDGENSFPKENINENRPKQPITSSRLARRR